jgi:DNA excision repair protein ERCC-2
LKKILHLSVRSLVMYVTTTGDLESTFTGSSRLAEGIRAHVKVQKSRPKEYSKEVTISHTEQTDHVELEIKGRIDGVFDYPDKVIVDEIKTTHKDLSSFEKKENAKHWCQVKVYAYFYALQHGLEAIFSQLTYYHLGTGEIKEIVKEFSIEELETFFKSLIKGFLKWHNSTARWEKKRDESIKVLDFPFDTYRPGQRKMAVDTYLTIKQRSMLIVQAPTGIGKTIAAIFPALKCMAEEHTSKVFYLTARTTGKSIANNALRILRENGLKVKSITLTAKDKICFEKQSSCNAEECEYAKGYYDRLGGALQAAFSKENFDRETIEDISLNHNICPFEFSLDISLFADIIICDYNYVFDPRVYLRRFFEDNDSIYTFLVDEAHNLVDRSREMFSSSLKKEALLKLRLLLKDDLPKIYTSLGKINAWFAEKRELCDTGDGFYSESEKPEDLMPLLKKFLMEAEKWLSLNKNADFKENLLEQYFEVINYKKISEDYDSSYISYYEQFGKDLFHKLFCINPSTRMEETLKRCGAAIFFSATMTPVDYFKELFGCRDEAYDLVLPSPFPKENLEVYISDNISTFYKNRDNTKGKIAELLISFIKQKQGNYFFFFPSYAYMALIHEAIGENFISDIEFFVQTPEMTEEERDLFLEQFVPDPTRTLVGFVVMGGIFGEGIDLVGNRLSGAAILSVGLPGISNERELIRKYFYDLNRKGFEFSYIYPGMNRVLQAAGRVIRTDKDRGTILLIDERFTSVQYRHLLNMEWEPNIVKSNNDFLKSAELFWNTD